MNSTKSACCKSIKQERSAAKSSERVKKAHTEKKISKQRQSKSVGVIQKSAKKSISDKPKSKESKMRNEQVDAGKSRKSEDKVKKPPKAIIAYLYFQNETIPKIRAEEGVTYREAMVKAGELWQTLSEIDKELYNKMHLQDVIRYHSSAFMLINRFEKEMKEFTAKGYYTLPDGTKSSEIEDPAQKKKSKQDSKEASGQKRPPAMCKRMIGHNLKSGDKKSINKKSVNPEPDGNEKP